MAFAHIHLLGICGTFMGGLALIARELGFKVTGCDTNIYPPMSTLLQEQGIEIVNGFLPSDQPKADHYIIGNAVSRGNPLVEWILNQQCDYSSGPEFLSEHCLKKRWVLAVSGTHGKTTTSSMLAWILEYAGLAPGYLIGGVPNNFSVSARLGQTPFFVIEADEYDSAIFDKRSKFVHYHPRTLIINNIEFDHGDIFENLAAIEKQFHHLVRLVPSEGQIIAARSDASIETVFKKGLWSPCAFFNEQGDSTGYISSQQILSLQEALVGVHNIKNAIASLLAALHVGVPISVGVEAMQQYQGVKRRLEYLGSVSDVHVFDDFAHHPTAIQVTLAALKEKMQRHGWKGRVLAMVEPRSNTMKLGLHKLSLEDSLQEADLVYWYQPLDALWDFTSQLSIKNRPRFFIRPTIQEMIDEVVKTAKPDDVVIIMSNGSFGGLHQKLLQALLNR